MIAAIAAIAGLVGAAVAACGDPGASAGQAATGASAASTPGDAERPLDGGAPADAASDAGALADGGMLAEIPDGGEPPDPDEDLVPDTLPLQREAMLRRMALRLGLSADSLDKVKEILGKSKGMGQGNPKATRYAMTRKECRERRSAAAVVDAYFPGCGAKYMVPVPNADGSVSVCVDAYEFPGIPCDYPLVWVSSREASDLCGAVGKRLCDAHEWEGACAGTIRSPDVEYAFGKSRSEMRRAHNQDREILWSYGFEKDHKKCGTQSKKNKGCMASGKACGSNTYPAGSFPECKSKQGVFDLHGNAAEHMSLPMKPTELGSAGGSGQTEMKGSWFIFSGYEAHPDDCRWRAPDWHATRVKDVNSHANYHLGFRCCKDVSGTTTPQPPR